MCYSSIYFWIIDTYYFTNCLKTKDKFSHFFDTFHIDFLFHKYLSWTFVRKYLLQPIEILLNDENITLNYLSQDLLKAKKSLTTTLDKIAGFSDFSNGRDLKFKLIFKEGQTFTLFKSGIWNRKDDFKTLQEDFKIFIYNYNENERKDPKKNERKIKYGDDTYLIVAVTFWIFSIFLIFSLLDSFDAKKFIGFLILLILGFINFSLHIRIKKEINK